MDPDEQLGLILALIALGCLILVVVLLATGSGS
jgi:hypothetical protein